MTQSLHKCLQRAQNPPMMMTKRTTIDSADEHPLVSHSHVPHIENRFVHPYAPLSCLQSFATVHL
eukprot:m.119687 g.119687  ORF g.119687 m.119687 type:complete len:65 (+) comp52063_c0_seq1:449-643(+)